MRHEKSRTGIRYSLSFKQQVVRVIESGRFSVLEARREYGIGSNAAIYNWLRQYGSDPSYKEVVRVNMIDEKSRIQALQEENAALKEALAEISMQKIASDVHLEVALKYLSPEQKKTVFSKLSRSQHALLNRVDKKRT